MAWSQQVKINGLDLFKKGLTELQLTQYPFAMKNSINDLSAMVLSNEKALMRKEFDRPTPFTINALKINYATKTNLSGGVVFKDPVRLSESQHYLYPNVYGTKRGYKKFEAALYAKGIMPAGYYAVPGRGAKQLMDAYGNIPGSTIVQILAWFGANSNAGYIGNSTAATKAKKKRGTKKKYGYEYFAIKKRTGKLLPGIYKRTFTGFGTSLESIFIYVPKSQVGYQRHYTFYEEAKKTMDATFKNFFGYNMDKALATAFK